MRRQEIVDRLASVAAKWSRRRRRLFRIPEPETEVVVAHFTLAIALSHVLHTGKFPGAINGIVFGKMRPHAARK